MRRLFWIVPAVIVLDQLTKALARTMTEPVTLIPGVIGLCHIENTGMSFSMLSGRSWLLGCLSLVLVIVGWAVLRRFRLGGLAGISAMLMLGGALGNAIDRLIRQTVTDMVELLFINFAVFNVADLALTAGCLLMALSLFICPQCWERRESRA